MARPSHYWSRRQFVRTASGAGLAVLAGCGRLPWPAQAPTKAPRIGFLAPSIVDLPLFVQGLREFGYVEGQNIAIEPRFAEETVEQLLRPAAELVRLPVDVIVTVGTPAATAAKQATDT